MKSKFDSNQTFQLDASQSVVDVFDGQPLAQGGFEIRLGAWDQTCPSIGRAESSGYFVAPGSLSGPVFEKKLTF